jgi:glycerol uptake operon antiterminator
MISPEPPRGGLGLFCIPIMKAKGLRTLTHFYRPTTGYELRDRIIPVVENRVQFAQVLDHTRSQTLLLRHCNLFDLVGLLDSAHRRGYSIYVNVDQMDGVYPDSAGLPYLAKHLHIAGIVSNHAKILSLGKSFGLATIQRIFAVDSTGLESALESVDSASIDLLDISPALVIPALPPDLLKALPLPFIGSGLVSTTQHVDAILRAGAQAVTVMRQELWST